MRTVIDAPSAALRDDVEKLRLLSREELHARYTAQRLTLLMIAAAAGSERALRFLLDAGVPVDAAADDLRTAVMFAAERHRPSVLHTLLQAGASPNTRDAAGSTPLVLALNRADSLDELAETVRLLVAAGADPTVANDNGATAFSAAQTVRRTWQVPLLKNWEILYPPSRRASRRLLRILAASVDAS